MFRRIWAHALSDVDVRFVSLVRRGANRIPFRFTKKDESPVDFFKFFHKSEAAPPAETTVEPDPGDAAVAAVLLTLAIHALASLGLLAAEDGCPTPPVPGWPVPGPSNAATDGTLACEIWSGCADGYRLALCRHPGGHVLPAGWVALAHAWARSLPDHVAGHDGG